MVFVHDLVEVIDILQSYERVLRDRGVDVPGYRNVDQKDLPSQPLNVARPYYRILRAGRADHDVDIAETVVESVEVDYVGFSRSRFQRLEELGGVAPRAVADD